MSEGAARASAGATLADGLRTRLREVDARLDAASPERRSLDPSRRKATRLEELADIELAGVAEPFHAAYVHGLCSLAIAQLESFPENIFWDLDFPAREVLRQATECVEAEGSDVGRALLVELFERMAGLQRLYGHQTPISFRYVHDFTYGYDWVKWVGREPDQDGSVGPFDLDFLRYMDRRGHELLALIEADDAKYPQLRDEKPRNPFPFSREPDDEVRLLSALAERGEIPVEAWRVDAKPEWERPYAKLRVECAGRMGLLVEG